MNAIAPCTLPDEAEPLAQQMRMLTDLADNAMRLARLSVEQYEASVTRQADSATAPPRRQPCPGSLFIRAARVVLNCILGQSRLAAGHPITPRASAPQAANPAPTAEQSRAEPVRQALRTVTRNHPQGPKLLSASLQHLTAALAATPSGTPSSTHDLPNLFRHVCNVTGIRLNPAQERKAARDLACAIRTAPA